jgi:hypothetical protein
VLKTLGIVLGKAGSGFLRFILALVTGMGATRVLLSVGSALTIASFSFLLEGPLLFHVPFFIGVFVLAFVAASRLLKWLSIR